MRTTSDKKLKIAFMICALIYFIQGGVCLIVDFAINRGVTWSAYPLLSVAFVWVIVSVLLLAPGHRIVFSLAAFSVLVCPYLYLVSSAIRFFVSKFLNTGFFSFDMMINLFACVSAAALFGIIGYARAKDNS